MPRIYTIILALFFPAFVYAQTAIDVAENTFKVSPGSQEVFYYGFAAGDQMILNFEEVNGKELKELEVLELPGSSKFMDYKTSSIKNKTLTVSRNSIYQFRLKNSSIAARICRIKIQRIPIAESTKTFNSTVFWKTVTDTIYQPVQERYLVKSDTLAIDVADQVSRVSSQTAINGSPNRTIVQFDLPEGTISWSYYIGVGSEGKKAFDEGQEKFLSAAAKTVFSIPGGGPMASLALHGLNYFNKVQGADNVQFSFITDWPNVLAFQAGKAHYQYKEGNVINDAGRMESAPANRRIYIGLYNDNLMDPIDVTIKATAIKVQQQWAVRTVNKMSLSNRQEPYLK